MNNINKNKVATGYLILFIFILIEHQHSFAGTYNRIQGAQLPKGVDPTSNVKTIKKYTGSRFGTIEKSSPNKNNKDNNFERNTTRYNAFGMIKKGDLKENYDHNGKKLGSVETQKTGLFGRKTTITRDATGNITKIEKTGIFGSKRGGSTTNIVHTNNGIIAEKERKGFFGGTTKTEALFTGKNAKSIFKGSGKSDNQDPKTLSLDLKKSQDYTVTNNINFFGKDRSHSTRVENGDSNSQRITRKKEGWLSLSSSGSGVTSKQTTVGVRNKSGQVVMKSFEERGRGRSMVSGATTFDSQGNKNAQTKSREFRDPEGNLTRVVGTHYNSDGTKTQFVAESAKESVDKTALLKNA